MKRLTLSCASIALLAFPPAGFAADNLREDWNLRTRAGEEAPFQAYRPNYFLPARRTSQVNDAPSSPAPGRTVSPPEDLDSTEAKFQLSVKSQLWGGDSLFGGEWLGFDRFRLWFAYTQQSHWQSWNTARSSPFRESNYEPELIATFGRAAVDSGFRLFNLGVALQSNGQSIPKSRSWRRVYGQLGFDLGNFSLLARLWRRTDRRGDADDNPGIEDYVGRGELVLQYRARGHSAELLLRDNLKRDPNRGLAQLDWSMPWFWPFSSLNQGSSRFHLQASSGYGESLIDYNHRQATVGVGVSLGFGRR